jgi:hypothetical protein
MSFGKQDFASPLPHALGQRAVGVFQTLVSLIFSTLGKGSHLCPLRTPESMSGMVPKSFGLFLFGLLSLVLALVGTFTGKAYGRGGSATARAEDPSGYWTLLTLEYVGGIFFIWLAYRMSMS